MVVIKAVNIDWEDDEYFEAALEALEPVPDIMDVGISATMGVTMVEIDVYKPFTPQLVIESLALFATAFGPDVHIVSVHGY